MIAVILARIVQAVPVVLAVGLIAYAMFAFVGDPVTIMLGQDYTAAQKAALIHQFGLDQPFTVQYARYIWGALHGGFGASYRLARPVSALLAERLPATLELAFAASLLALAVGLPMGVYAGLHRASPLSRLFMVFSAATLQPGRLARAWDSDLTYGFRRSPVAVLAALVLLLIVAAAVLCRFVAPYDPFDLASLSLLDSFKPPAFMPGGAAAHLPGTDDQGRDMLSAILYGMRLSLIVAGAAVLLAPVLGVAAGLAAAYLGGIADALLVDGVVAAALPPSAHESLQLQVLILATSPHPRHRRLALAAVRPHRARLHDGGARQGLRAGGAGDRPLRPAHHGDARPMADRGRTPVGGEIPNPISPPSGCPFHPRCPLAGARCTVEKPGYTRAGEVLVACHAAEEGQDRL